MEAIETNIGVAQGDHFIFYLAHIIGPISPETSREDHDGEVNWSDLDWIIDRDEHNIVIDPKYADNITFIRSCINTRNISKWELTGK